jgi:hypothetical protein
MKKIMTALFIVTLPFTLKADCSQFAQKASESLLDIRAQAHNYSKGSVSDIRLLRKTSDLLFYSASGKIGWGVYEITLMFDQKCGVQEVSISEVH